MGAAAGVSSRSLCVVGVDGLSVAEGEALLGASTHLACLAGSREPISPERAWATIMTGTPTGWHGVYGSTDRVVRSYDLYRPRARNLKQPDLASAARAAGIATQCIDVPLYAADGTTPSGPQALCSAIDGFLDRQPSTLVVARTSIFDGGDAADSSRRMSNITSLGVSLKQLMDGHPNTAWMLLSSYAADDRPSSLSLNGLLASGGWLGVDGPPWDLAATGHTTKAFALTEGRVYLNLAGREPVGVVSPLGRGLDQTLDALSADISAGLESRGVAGAEVLRADALYRGPWEALAPDLVVHVPATVALREDFAGVSSDTAPGRSQAGGFVGLVGHRLGQEGDTVSLEDVYPSVAEIVGLPVPQRGSGRSRVSAAVV